MFCKTYAAIRAMSAKVFIHIWTSKQGYGILLALIVSISSFWVAWEAKNDTRAIHGLDLRPVITLDTVLRDTKDHPAFYYVTNRGPVDVLQLRIRLISHRLGSKGGESAGFATGDDTYVEKLAPHKSISYPFPPHYLDVAKWGEQKDHNVVEIRLTYLCPPDMRKVVKSAFYFLNPAGLWVSELDNSLTPEIYDPIKKLLFEMLKRDHFYYEPETSDVLHEKSD